MFISWILKKVFDSVVRKALMYKLLCKGIGGKLYDLLMHMYSNTLYCCRSEGYISESFQANLGVKQVDSLSPILFNIFVDDICSYFNNSLADPVLLNNIHFIIEVINESKSFIHFSTEMKLE
jgi:hypothetical protein